MLHTQMTVHFQWKSAKRYFAETDFEAGARKGWCGKVDVY